MLKPLSSPPLDGWLVLDKPLGMSSARAVGHVRRALGAAKAGHGGTLDPLATGVLPIALGEATKTMSFVMNGAKAYRFTVTWGSETSTDDLEGAVTSTSGERPSRNAIQALVPKFTGEIEQVPPSFSAIRIGGARSYARARQGEEIELPPRTVRIDALTLLDATPEQAVFAARAPMSAPSPATWGVAWAVSAMSRHCAGLWRAPLPRRT
jgi:tRNA pseudouridine55 synthase